MTQGYWRLADIDNRVEAYTAGTSATESITAFGEHDFGVALLPLGWRAKEEILAIEEVLVRWLRVRVIRMEPTSIPSHARNFLKGTIEAIPILDHLSAQLPSTADRIMAVTDTALTDGENECFGVADPFDDVAIYSVSGLREADYHRQPNRMLELKRSIWVFLHELAHTFGLKHCDQEGCTMLPARPGGVHDLDTREPHYCARCWSRVSSGLRTPRTSPTGLYLRAGASLKHGRVREAIGGYLAAIRLTPLNPKYWNDLGVAYAHNQAPRDAARSWIYAKDLVGNLRIPQPFYNLGVLLQLNGKTAFALALMQKGLERDPNQIDAHAYLGYVYREVFKRPDLAQQAYVTYFRLGGTSPSVIEEAQKVGVFVA